MTDASPGRPGTTLSRFVAEHGRALGRFAYLICGDRGRAEDLVQDVLLAMYRRFGDDVPLDRPLAYARRAVVNANVSWSRRPYRRDLLLDAPPERAVYDADPAVRDEFWQLLRVLPARQRAVLVLRYHLGYSDAEIAELLGCRRASVRSLAHRALADLRGRHRTRALTEGTDR